MSALPPRERLVHLLRRLAERADAPALAALLHPDAVAVIDSGGDDLGPATLRGAAAVARELIATVAPGATVIEQSVNGDAALVVRRRSRVVAVVTFGAGDGPIRRVWIVRSPRKLRHWN